MIHIVLVDKMRLVCDVIGAALAKEPDFRVLGIATSVDDALEQLANARCDVVLLSTSLPGNGAMTLLVKIRDMYPETSVLVMGVADSEAVILRYIEAGAAGYLLREDSVDKLQQNIRIAYEDKALISPSLTAKLITRIAELSQQIADVGTELGEHEELTPREQEILALISSGLTNKEIGEKLTIEVGTVKNHVHSILSKLQVNSRRDAAQYLSLLNKKQGIKPEQAGSSE